MSRTWKPRRGITSCAQGFSLVETVIAVAVIAVTFIGIIGLLGLGVVSDQTSSDQTVATNIAAAILADVRGTLGNIPGSTVGSYTVSPNSSVYSIPLPTTDTVNSPPLSGASPSQVLYFDNIPNMVQAGGVPPASAVYKASVYVVQLSHVGNGSGGIGQSQYNELVRVLVTWPAQATTPSVGNVDILTQLRLN
jgi:type II secretory pathway pseudopilin PulG